MKCSKCGNVVNENSRFCSHCGNPIVIESQFRDSMNNVAMSAATHKEISYHPFLLYRGKTIVNQRDIKVIHPKKPFLGILGTGKTTNTIPIHNISNVQIDSNLDWKRIGLGMLMILGGFFFMPIGLLISLIGVIVILSGNHKMLVISHNGTAYEVPALFFDNKKLVEIEEAIQAAMI